MLAEAVAELKPSHRGGQLTVTAAPSFAARWLMPRLHRFIDAHPEVEVRVSARTRLFTRTEQRSAERATVDRWLENSDVGIIYGHGEYAGLRVDRLLSLTVAPLCSPQLLRGQHPLREPADIRHHSLVHDDTGLLGDGESFWDVWLEGAGVKDIDTNRGPHFSQPVLAIEAASDHLGVVATFPVFASSELANGRLVLPFELEVPLRSGYYLVSTPAVAQRAEVVAFRNWLLAEAAGDKRPQTIRN
jgi:LysR family glycine cleavage system transcriptional activator